MQPGNLNSSIHSAVKDLLLYFSWFQSEINSEPSSPRFNKSSWKNSILEASRLSSVQKAWAWTLCHPLLIEVSPFNIVMWGVLLWIKSKGNDQLEEKSLLLLKMEIKVCQNFFMMNDFVLKEDKEDTGMIPHYYIKITVRRCSTK